MQFAKGFPDELRLQINASEVISKKTALQKKGKEFLGLCPFHNEKTPSFTVNDQKGFYHCFGCGAHGDIIGFVINSEGLDFKEAVVKLANDFNIPIPIIRKEEQKFVDERESKLSRKYQLLEEITNFFSKNLFEYQGQEALNYLQKRGLDHKNIKKFRLGFAANSYDSLHSHLTKLGFSNQELLESGAVGQNIKSGQNGKLYDKFRNRVIFPISAKNGKIIAFGGRILNDGQPKYLNSSETELFKKGSNLYNYFFARKAIFDTNFAVIVEGYMDVLALDINGISNVVAPLGTAVTQEQITELFKITNDIVVCLDGDNAGIKAMERVIDLALPLINSSHMVRFALLPGGLDPDDFIKQYGKNACQDLLQSAKTLSQTLFDFEGRKIGILNFTQKITPEKKANLESKLMQKVALINDAQSKRYFSQYYKDLLFSIGKNKAANKQNIANANLAQKDTSKLDLEIKIDEATLYAIHIIALLVADPKLIDYRDDYINIRQLDFEDETLSNIKESLIEKFDYKNDYESQNLLEFFKNLAIDQKIKDKILLRITNSSNNQFKLRILALKYHHCQISKQYQDALGADNFETNNSTVIGGKYKELFDYKTKLEKQILELESNLT